MLYKSILVAFIMDWVVHLFIIFIMYDFIPMIKLSLHYLQLFSSSFVFSVFLAIFLVKGLAPPIFSHIKMESDPISLLLFVYIVIVF